MLADSPSRSIDVEPPALTRRRARADDLESTPPGAGQRVVYVADAAANGTGDVSVIHAIGGPRRVFGSGSQPTWTQDAKSLIFVDNDTIYRVAADGTGHRTELFAGGGRLKIKDRALSPDDRMVAYAAQTTGEGSNYDIYVIRVGSNQPRHLTHLRSTDDMPRWLDSDTLLFRSSRGRKWGVWQPDVAAEDEASEQSSSD